MNSHVGLRIDGLDERHPGLTAAVAATYYEAACVCLDRHHRPPTSFRLESDEDVSDLLVEWAVSDERSRMAWANDVDRTECGASAVAIAAAETALGMVAVRRAETRSGADYYLMPAGQEADDLETAFRLEISGIDSGPVRAVYQRVRQKVEQVLRGTSNLPAVVGVTGFGCARIVLQAVEALE